MRPIHFSDLMCCDALKIICSRGDLTGESEGIFRAERGASVIGHIIRNKAKRFGLRSRQPQVPTPLVGSAAVMDPPGPMAMASFCVDAYALTRRSRSAYEMDRPEIREALSESTWRPGTASTVMLMWMLSENASVKTSAAAIHACLCRCCVDAEIRVEPGRKRGSNDQTISP